MLRVARYRFQTTFRQRRGGYLALVLLIGLVGGLAIGVVAAARRTQSSFPRFLAGTKPSDVYSNAFLNPTPDGKIVPVARIAHVTKFESQADLAVGPVPLNGAPPRALITGQVISLGSIDGLGFDQDRVSVVAGRMADPKRADEFVMTADAARLLGVHVGEVVPLGVFSTEQLALPDFGTASVQPFRRTRAKLVGLVVFNNAVVQDDIERVPHIRAVHTRVHAEVLVVLRVRRGDGAPTRSARPGRRGGGCDRAGTPRRGRVLLPRGRDGRGEGAAGHQAGGDRARRVRRHHRAGRVADRRPGDRPAAPAGDGRRRRLACPRRGAGHDGGRRAARHAGRGRARVTDGRRGRGRPVTVRTPRPDAPGRPLPRHRVRRARARARRAGVDHDPERSGGRVRVPERTPSSGPSRRADRAEGAAPDAAPPRPRACPSRP